jgi:uncharacterized protein (DUF2235 family)
MTRIAIFCDGTWNSPDLDEPTSIHKLQGALLNDPSKGQVCAYFSGIGTDDRFDGSLKKFFNKWGGGIFGWGLDAKVKQAYQFLCQAYQPNDEIFLFGFSRGAYTARSVAGMIRKCGIVDNPTPERINEAFKLYRRKGTQNSPDEPHIMTERKRLSPRFASSLKDADWRGGGAIVKIAYVGVFDTVGARGMPPSLLGPLATAWNSQYKFHDMALSSLVKSARHALAIDEQRVFYVPAKWDNLDKQGLKNGLNNGDVSAKEQPRSSIALEWMLDGARGLKLNRGVKFPPTPSNPLYPLDRLTKKRKLLKKWRECPVADWELHPSARKRVNALAAYRPKSLHKIF